MSVILAVIVAVIMARIGLVGVVLRLKRPVIMPVPGLARMIIHRRDFPRGTCIGRVALVDYVHSASKIDAAGRGRTDAGERHRR